MSTWPINPLERKALSHANKQMTCPAGRDLKCIKLFLKPSYSFSSFCLDKFHTELQEQGQSKKNKLEKRVGPVQRKHVCLEQQKCCEWKSFDDIKHNIPMRWNIINKMQLLCLYITSHSHYPSTLSSHSERPKTSDHSRWDSRPAEIEQRVDYRERKRTTREDIIHTRSPILCSCRRQKTLQQTAWLCSTGK